MCKRSKQPFLYAVLMMLILASCQEEETVAPVVKNIEEAVFASGYVEQENNYTVSAKAEGIIVDLPVKEGDPIATSQVVATLENDVQDNQLTDALVVHDDALDNASPDSPQLQHLQAQIEQAERQLNFDRENYERYRDLWEKESVSKLDFSKAELQYQSAQSHLLTLRENYAEVQNSLQLNVERTRVQVNTQTSMLKDYQLTTKASGQVIKVFKKQGELARRGEAIAQIGSGAYVIRLFVSEEDITKINIDNPVAININTYPDRTFPAKVTKILPAFDEAEQSYIVEARFEQMPKKMFSGTQLQANIKTGTRKNVLVIPSDYLAKGSYVRLQGGEEKQIETGSKNREWTEVISGIMQDDIIVKPLD